MKIAIDGPAGSGKSTVSKILAKKLDIEYLDTGAMYRTCTLYLLNNKIDLDNLDQIKKSLDKMNFKIENNNFYLDGKNINKDIRKPIVNENVSKVASYKFIRKKMVELQKQIAKTKDVIMDGRDIGTHVLPNADYKFYLDASVKQRAKRRFDELIEDGEKVDFEDILESIKKRDKKDMNRKHAPLTKAEDATVIDTTNLNVKEVIEKIILEVKKND
ncbi:MAG: (d)CMP kinase [Bacillota bacterium]